MHKLETKSEYIPINAPNAWEDRDRYLSLLLTDPWYKHVSAISSALYIASHRFFEAQSISPFVFPITTGSVSSPMGMGSDSQPVKIQLRNNKVFLADSMQFSLEVGTRLNPNGAYYIMPTFRGEAVDARHLNEFVHAEAEIPGTLNDVFSLAQDYVTFLVNEAVNNCEDSIIATAGSLDHIERCLSKRGQFEKIRYDDAITELAVVDGALEDIGTGYQNITSAGERHLLSKMGDFIWLTNMPWMNVPFYQAQEANSHYSMTGDLLAGIGEILGCGQRVRSTSDLEQSLTYHNVSIEGYKWYGEMRQLQPLQTAGFGLGIERLVLWLTQTSDIRNCTLLYRDHDQVYYP